MGGNKPVVCVPTDEDYLTGTGGSLYDGKQQVLYWADVSSELAIVVPSPETFRQRATSSSTLESGLFAAGVPTTLLSCLSSILSACCRGSQHFHVCPPFYLFAAGVPNILLSFLSSTLSTCA